MANHNLFNKKINDIYGIQFTRDDNLEDKISWHILLINNKTNDKLLLDSYTLPKRTMVLGDPIRIAGGEDMIFHHDLANVIWIDKTLFVVHNMQGTILLRSYTFISPHQFTKDHYFLTKYRPVGALGGGVQYADFLKYNNNLFILINAGNEMSDNSERGDQLFKLNIINKKLYSISFFTEESNNEHKYAKVSPESNPFVFMDLKTEHNIDLIRKILYNIIIKNSDNGTSYKYIGAMENMNSDIGFRKKEPIRTISGIYFFYTMYNKIQIARFRSLSDSQDWFLGDYQETPVDKLDR